MVWGNHDERERWNYEEITLHKKWQGGCKLLTSILTFSEKLKKLQKHFHVPFQIHIISPTLSIFTQIFISSIWGWVDDDDENKNLIIKMRRKIIEFFPIDIEALFFSKGILWMPSLTISLLITLFFIWNL